MEYVSNIGKKLSNVREMCPGMKEEVYIFCDYMAKIVTPTEIPARGIVGLVFLIVEDIQNKQKGFLKYPLPEALIQSKERIFEVVSEIPKVIEAIVDNEKFVKEFFKEYEKRLEAV